MHSSTIQEQIHTALTGDTILAMLGFCEGNVGERRRGPGFGMVVTWSSTWHGSRSALVGTVTVDVIGVSDQTRRVVVDRIAVVLGRLPALDGPIRRVRRRDDSSTSFTVLARTTQTMHPPEN